MKLSIFINGNPNNPKVWSGTPKRLCEEFAKIEGVSVSTIDYSLPRWWKSLCCRVLSFHKNEFIIGGSRDPWYRAWMECRLNRALAKESPSEWCLFICDHNCPKHCSGDKRYAVYVDGAVEVFLQHLGGHPFWRKWYEDYTLKYERQSLQNADLIFTQNEWSRQFYINEWNIPHERVYNLGFGINLRPYEGEKDYSRSELLIVLRRGTEHYKGLDLLLDAFEILRKRCPHATLNVVGTTQRPLEGVTYWEGYPREKTVELFQRSTLYVMPALREPNGITYLEALANRTPIIGLNRFAVPEFSGNGQWGFMAEHEDAKELSHVIEVALSDTNRLSYMGQIGQRFVAERYDWTKVARQMIEIMHLTK